MHFAAHGGRQLSWILAAMDDQIHRQPGVLGIGQIDDRISLFLEVVVLDVSHDSDDFPRFLLATTEIDPLSDWLLTR